MVVWRCCFGCIRVGLGLKYGVAFVAGFVYGVSAGFVLGVGCGAAFWLDVGIGSSVASG